MKKYLNDLVDDAQESFIQSHFRVYLESCANYNLGGSGNDVTEISHSGKSTVAAVMAKFNN